MTRKELIWQDEDIFRGANVEQRWAVRFALNVFLFWIHIIFKIGSLVKLSSDLRQRIYRKHCCSAQSNTLTI